MNKLEWFEQEYFRRRMSTSLMQETLHLATNICFQQHEITWVQQHPLWRAADSLMSYLDAAATNSCVTYHNNHHFADTILAAALLASAEPGLSATLRLVLLSTMCAHDVHHDGTSNTETKSLELISAKVFEGYMQSACVPCRLRDLVSRTILSTDPKKAALNRDCYLASTNSNVYDESALLAGLAHDADLLGSLLSRSGLDSSKSLATEWMLSGQPNAQNVATFKGRAYFLSHAEPITRAAQLLGIRDSHAAQLEALRGFDATSHDVIAGGAYLDTLDGEAAKALYLDATNAVLHRFKAENPQRYTEDTSAYHENESPFLP